MKTLTIKRASSTTLKYHRMLYILKFILSSMSQTSNFNFLGNFVSVPTKPQNFTSRGITSTTIELSWSEPESANGVITGYRVYYLHSNYTDVQTLKIYDNSGPNVEFVLKDLGKYELNRA